MSDDQPEGERTVLVPVAWLAIFAVAIFLVGRALPGRVPLDQLQETAAVLIAAAGFALPVAALARFRRHRTTFHPGIPGEATSLVTDGVYRLTRNPMYVGMAVVLAAEAVWFGSLLGLLLVPVFVGVLTAAQIVPEERAMERLFGDEWRVYKHRTPRWLFL